MQTEYLIAVDEFCANLNIEISFISSLQQTGLIEITTIKETGLTYALSDLLNITSWILTWKVLRPSLICYSE